MVNHITDQQSVAGAKLKSILRADTTNEKIIISTKSTISILEDTDMVEAVTRLNAFQVSLQAAQQSFARVQQLSLFNYL